MIEYKVYNDSTKEQIKHLLERGKRALKTKTLNDVIQENKKRKHTIQRLNELENEIISL